MEVKAFDLVKTEDIRVVWMFAALPAEMDGRITTGELAAITGQPEPRLRECLRRLGTRHSWIYRRDGSTPAGGVIETYGLSVPPGARRHDIRTAAAEMLAIRYEVPYLGRMK